MAIIGIQTDRTNPSFSINDFTFWMPQFKKYMATSEGRTAFNNLYPIANNKVFESIFGSDWTMAMSLCIAHYLQLIANNTTVPAGSTLAEVAGGGAYRGIISSASVGGFNKSFDNGMTMSDSDDAKFWNQTAYGTQFWALLQTKAVLPMMVVTSNPIPGAN